MNELQIKWLEALRSGEYEQGAGALFLEGKRCCLGVADAACFDDDRSQHSHGYLTDMQAVRLGLTPADQNHLSGANDGVLPGMEERRFTFAEIATALEAYWTGEAPSLFAALLHRSIKRKESTHA